MRSKTSPVHSSKESLFRSLSIADLPVDRKRKWLDLSLLPQKRYPEQHNLRRWAYARREEYNRYLLPRTLSTEITEAVKSEQTEEDLLGLAFIDEMIDG